MSDGPGYRKALKEMISSQEPFSFEKIRSRNGISHVSTMLRDFGWIKVVEVGGNAVGSIWCGPIPGDDSELDAMVLKIVRRRRELEKEKRNQNKKDRMEQDYNAYRSLIERLAKGAPGFDTEAIAEGLRIYGDVAEKLRELHWVKARKGSDLEFWIGPVINTDEELGKATRFLMQQQDKDVPESVPDDRDYRIEQLQKIVDAALATNEEHVKEKRRMSTRMDELTTENNRLKRELSKREVKVEPISIVKTNGHANEVSVLWGMFKMKRAK